MTTTTLPPPRLPPRRWGIVGYGWVARDHMAPAIVAAGDRVVAVADPSEAARAAAAADGIKAFESLDAMLERGGCDTVYVATPNDRHAEAVQRVAAAGLPVLCEKPMASTLAGAEAMVAAVAAAGVTYGTAFDQRHHPAHAALRECIAGGSIGVPIAVRIVYACWVSAAWSPLGSGNGAGDGDGSSAGANWRTDRQAAGGGAVIDLALHGLDLVQLLLGEPVERLHIELQRRIHDYPVDDGGMLIGRTAGGVLVSQHVAYNCAETLPRRRLEVLGDAGLLVAVDTMGQTAGGRVTLTCARTGRETPVGFDTGRSPFTAQVEAFGRAASGRPQDDFSVERDIALMRVFDAAYRQALDRL